MRLLASLIMRNTKIQKFMAIWRNTNQIAKNQKILKFKKFVSLTQLDDIFLPNGVIIDVP